MLPQESRPASPHTSHMMTEIISSILVRVTGTNMAVNVPLMASGVDSIAGAELASLLTDQFATDLP